MVCPSGRWALMLRAKSQAEPPGISGSNTAARSCRAAKRSAGRKWDLCGQMSGGLGHSLPISALQVTFTRQEQSTVDCTGGDPGKTGGISASTKFSTAASQLCRLLRLANGMFLLGLNLLP